MRRILFSLIASMTILCGCDVAVEMPQAEIKFTSNVKNEVDMAPYGDKVSIRFTASLDWTVEYSAEWLEVTPMSGGPGSGRISVTAGANYDGETRTAVVNICSGGQEYPVTVTQESYVPTFDLVETDAEISFLGGELSVSLLADVGFECTSDADWVRYINSAGSNKIINARFYVDPNMESSSRSAVIAFASDTETLEFTITQGVEDYGTDNWTNASFAQRSLAMRFTATWCPYCPYMGTAFDLAKTQMPENLELVCFHTKDSKYEFSGTTALENRFRIKDYPTGLVDARASIPNYTIYSYTATAAMEVAAETQAAYPSTVGIACSSRLSESDLSVSVGLYAKEEDSYYVTVLLLEDGIIGNQSGGGANYEHNDVARQALTSMSGNEVIITSDGEMRIISYTSRIDPDWDADNLKILVYVEKPYGDRERKEESSMADYGNFGGTYIDNCRVVKVGETAQLQLR